MVQAQTKTKRQAQAESYQHIEPTNSQNRELHKNHNKKTSSITYGL